MVGCIISEKEGIKVARGGGGRHRVKGIISLQQQFLQG